MLALILLALAQTPQHRLFLQPNLPAGQALAFFEFAPASGAGTTTACSTTAPTGAKGEALTFTRASVAECYSNDGQTLTQMAVNQPMVSSGTAASTWMGIWQEDASQNDILRARDLSQAVWTKTNMSCVRNAPGMRSGDVNGATTCTATAANATVCQTITTAAATRTSSWNLKRSAGTSAVTLARDGATYSSSIASSLSSTLWRRAVPSDTPGCAGGNCIIVPVLTGSVLNPQVCLKLATSGDAVGIDFVQDEAGDVATTPIDTAGVAVPRAASSPSFVHAAVSPRSFSAVFQLVGSSTFYALYDKLDASNSVWLQYNGGSAPAAGRNAYCATGVGGASSYTNNPFPSSYSATPISVSCTVGPNASDMAYWVRGAQTSTPLAGGTPAASTTLFLGTAGAAGSLSMKSGVIKGVKLDGTLTGGLRGAETTSSSPLIAWVGDSITYGTGGTSYRAPQKLGLDIGKYVGNFGVGGQTTTGCRDTWRNMVKGRGYSTLILLCGVNDLRAGTTAAVAWLPLKTAIDEALAEGLRVIVLGVVPWANAPGWTAGQQTESDSYNATIAAYPGITFASTASLGSGSPLALTVPNDSGDHLHPNDTGYIALSAIAQGTAP